MPRRSRPSPEDPQRALGPQGPGLAIVIVIEQLPKLFGFSRDGDNVVEAEDCCDATAGHDQASGWGLWDPAALASLWGV